MGSGSSAQQNYKPEENLPKQESAKVSVSFYGKGKPLDKSGKDKGLKEVWTSWAFPESEEKSVIILPAIEGVHGDWSQRRLSAEYDQRLAAYGLSEESLQGVVERLNTLLKAFFPFQRDRVLGKKTKLSVRGFNMLTKGVDCDTETFYYAVQMRKILAKAGMDFPNTSWSLHIHKHMNGSDSSFFTEVVYHSVRIDLCEDMPKWWNPSNLGTGSAWHTWDQTHSTRNFDLSKQIAPEGPGTNVEPSGRNIGSGEAGKGKLPEVTRGNSPLAKGIDKDNNCGGGNSKQPAAAGSPTGPPASAVVAASSEADARRAKRKGSASDTFAGLEQFAGGQK